MDIQSDRVQGQGDIRHPIQNRSWGNRNIDTKQSFRQPESDTNHRSWGKSEPDVFTHKKPATHSNSYERRNHVRNNIEDKSRNFRHDMKKIHSGPIKFSDRTGDGIEHSRAYKPNAFSGRTLYHERERNYKAYKCKPNRNGQLISERDAECFHKTPESYIYRSKIGENYNNTPVNQGMSQFPQRIDKQIKNWAEQDQIPLRNYEPGQTQRYDQDMMGRYEEDQSIEGFTEPEFIPEVYYPELDHHVPQSNHDFEDRHRFQRLNTVPHSYFSHNSCKDDRMHQRNKTNKSRNRKHYREASITDQNRTDYPSARENYFGQQVTGQVPENELRSEYYANEGSRHSQNISLAADSEVGSSWQLYAHENNTFDINRSQLHNFTKGNKCYNESIPKINEYSDRSDFQGTMAEQNSNGVQEYARVSNTTFLQNSKDDFNNPQIIHDKDVSRDIVNSHSLACNTTNWQQQSMHLSGPANICNVNLPWIPFENNNQTRVINRPHLKEGMPNIRSEYSFDNKEDCHDYNYKMRCNFGRNSQGHNERADVNLVLRPSDLKNSIYSTDVSEIPLPEEKSNQGVFPLSQTNAEKEKLLLSREGDVGKFPDTCNVSYQLNTTDLNTGDPFSVDRNLSLIRQQCYQADQNSNYGKEYSQNERNVPCIKGKENYKTTINEFSGLPERCQNKNWIKDQNLSFHSEDFYITELTNHPKESHLTHEPFLGGRDMAEKITDFSFLNYPPPSVPSQIGAAQPPLIVVAPPPQSVPPQVLTNTSAVADTILTPSFHKHHSKSVIGCEQTPLSFQTHNVDSGVLLREEKSHQFKGPENELTNHCDKHIAGQSDCHLSVPKDSKHTSKPVVQETRSEQTVTSQKHNLAVNVETLEPQGQKSMKSRQVISGEMTKFETRPWEKSSAASEQGEMPDLSNNSESQAKKLTSDSMSAGTQLSSGALPLPPHVLLQLSKCDSQNNLHMSLKGCSIKRTEQKNVKDAKYSVIDLKYEGIPRKDEKKSKDNFFRPWTVTSPKKDIVSKAYDECIAPGAFKPKRVELDIEKKTNYKQKSFLEIKKLSKIAKPLVNTQSSGLTSTENKNLIGLVRQNMESSILNLKVKTKHLDSEAVNSIKSHLKTKMEYHQLGLGTKTLLKPHGEQTNNRLKQLKSTLNLGSMENLHKIANGIKKKVKTLGKHKSVLSAVSDGNNFNQKQAVGIHLRGFNHSEIEKFGIGNHKKMSSLHPKLRHKMENLSVGKPVKLDDDIIKKMPKVSVIIEKCDDHGSNTGSVFNVKSVSEKLQDKQKNDAIKNQIHDKKSSKQHRVKKKKLNKESCSEHGKINALNISKKSSHPKKVVKHANLKRRGKFTMSTPTTFTVKHANVVNRKGHAEINSIEETEDENENDRFAKACEAAKQYLLKRQLQMGMPQTEPMQKCSELSNSKNSDINNQKTFSDTDQCNTAFEKSTTENCVEGGNNLMFNIIQTERKDPGDGENILTFDNKKTDDRESLSTLHEGTDTEEMTEGADTAELTEETDKAEVTKLNDTSEVTDIKMQSTFDLTICDEICSNTSEIENISVSRKHGSEQVTECSFPSIGYTTSQNTTAASPLKQTCFSETEIITTWKCSKTMSTNFSVNSLLKLENKNYKDEHYDSKVAGIYHNEAVSDENFTARINSSSELGENTAFLVNSAGVTLLGSESNDNILCKEGNREMNSSDWKTGIAGNEKMQESRSLVELSVENTKDCSCKPFTSVPLEITDYQGENLNLSDTIMDLGMDGMQGDHLDFGLIPDSQVELGKTLNHSNSLEVPTMSEASQKDLENSDAGLCCVGCSSTTQVEHDPLLAAMVLDENLADVATKSKAEYIDDEDQVLEENTKKNFFESVVNDFIQDKTLMKDWSVEMTDVEKNNCTENRPSEASLVPSEHENLNKTIIIEDPNKTINSEDPNKTIIIEDPNKTIISEASIIDEVVSGLSPFIPLERIDSFKDTAPGNPDKKQKESKFVSARTPVRVRDYRRRKYVKRFPVPLPRAKPKEKLHDQEKELYEAAKKFLGDFNEKSKRACRFKKDSKDDGIQVKTETNITYKENHAKLNQEHLKSDHQPTEDENNRKRVYSDKKNCSKTKKNKIDKQTQDPVSKLNSDSHKINEEIVNNDENVEGKTAYTSTTEMYKSDLSYLKPAKLGTKRKIPILRIKKACIEQDLLDSNREGINFVEKKFKTECLSKTSKMIKTTVKERTKHNKVNEKVEPYKRIKSSKDVNTWCAKCSRAFSSEELKKRHVRNDHDVKSTCTVCGIALCNRVAYRRHLSSVLHLRQSAEQRRQSSEQKGKAGKLIHQKSDTTTASGETEKLLKSPKLSKKSTIHESSKSLNLEIKNCKNPAGKQKRVHGKPIQNTVIDNGRAGHTERYQKESVQSNYCDVCHQYYSTRGINQHLKTEKHLRAALGAMRKKLEPQLSRKMSRRESSSSDVNSSIDYSEPDCYQDQLYCNDLSQDTTGDGSQLPTPYFDVSDENKLRKLALDNPTFLLKKFTPSAEFEKAVTCKYNQIVEPYSYLGLGIDSQQDLQIQIGNESLSSSSIGGLVRESYISLLSSEDEHADASYNVFQNLDATNVIQEGDCSDNDVCVVSNSETTKHSINKKERIVSVSSEDADYTESVLSGSPVAKVPVSKITGLISPTLTPNPICKIDSCYSLAFKGGDRGSK